MMARKSVMFAFVFAFAAEWHFQREHMLYTLFVVRNCVFDLSFCCVDPVLEV